MLDRIKWPKIRQFLVYHGVNKKYRGYFWTLNNSSHGDLLSQSRHNDLLLDQSDMIDIKRSTDPSSFFENCSIAMALKS